MEKKERKKYMDDNTIELHKSICIFKAHSPLMTRFKDTLDFSLPSKGAML